ncbi:hypothetical protein VQ02_17070 [Methylobacterium variabile]|jgi:hypothetical protein|uniref:Uncharacterized protein n=1 Tax=Methylobacterium variabile TaxID=298794 RepID=A0A0J6V9E4_9HYPH|nr:hypothetical protein [Methylobacterium variabile]KMO35596.1 hypothetical protein VQ02_17070 [Methylobacterium variabile]
MTAVSASSAAAQQVSSPKQRLLDRISAQQQSGALSATDADALSSAVQDIDAAMSGASGTGGRARLDPSQAKGRMDDLIGAEVDKGTLTSEQATTLKSLLSSQKGGGQGSPGGPPPGPPPSGDAAATGATGASATSASDLLSSFLKQLQDAQTQAQASGYGASGSTAKTGQAASQAAMFDFEA